MAGTWKSEIVKYYNNGVEQTNNNIGNYQAPTKTIQGYYTVSLTDPAIYGEVSSTKF